MRFRLNLGLVILLMPFLTSAYLFSTPPMSFCKCLCFGTNSTILPLYLPKDPLAPCLTCTRQFCLDQKLGICLGAKSGEEDLDTGKGESGDVEARCFQRDSVKHHMLVLLFIAATSSLLVGAALKNSGIDLPSMWSKGGIKGTIRECVVKVRGNKSSSESRGGSGSSYRSMPT